MKNNLIAILITLFLSPTVYGQQSGNQVIKSYYHNQTEQGHDINKLYLSDSAFIIQANVLMNVIADSYVATFGVSEVAGALKDANSNIDKRIQNFVAELNGIGVPQSNIYIDMTTQTQISDYKINENFAEQYISGYEQQKNVIVRFNNIKELDKMLLIAANHGIYDLAKVDYIVTDIETIYTQLFNTAMDVIKNKKDLYVKATNYKLSSTSEIYGESFYSYSPQQLYNSYTPNISTQYYNFNYNSTRKDLKKSNTYYYDRIDYSGFNKIINPVVTEPALAFVLLLQVKYNK